MFSSRNYSSLYIRKYPQKWNYMKILNMGQPLASNATTLYFGEFILWVNLTKTLEICAPRNNAIDMGTKITPFYVVDRFSLRSMTFKIYMNKLNHWKNLSNFLVVFMASFLLSHNVFCILKLQMTMSLEMHMPCSASDSLSRHRIKMVTKSYVLLLNSNHTTSLFTVGI